MQMLLSLVLVVQLLSALAMIGLVLIQHGKGADMGASFGSGASGSLFGATGSANFLSRSTAACATIFFVCTLALAYSSNDRAAPQASGGSVLDRAAPAAVQKDEGAAGQIPGAAGAVAPAAAPGATPGAAASATPGAAASGSAAIPTK
jgi:preprotein translocase subunit SecG